MTLGARWAESMQSVLGVSAVARYSRGNFLVHDDVDLYPSLGPPLQHLVQPPFLIVIGRSPQEEFWTQPPILDVDDLLCLLQRDGYGPEVVPSVNVPLDLVPIPFRSEGFETMAFGDASALGVCLLLVLFVVAMVGIDEVPELADLALEVVEAFLGLV